MAFLISQNDAVLETQGFIMNNESVFYYVTLSDLCLQDVLPKATLASHNSTEDDSVDTEGWGIKRNESVSVVLLALFSVTFFLSVSLSLCLTLDTLNAGHCQSLGLQAWTCFGKQCRPPLSLIYTWSCLACETGGDSCTVQTVMLIFIFIFFFSSVVWCQGGHSKVEWVHIRQKCCSATLSVQFTRNLFSCFILGMSLLFTLNLK